MYIANEEQMRTNRFLNRNSCVLHEYMHVFPFKQIFFNSMTMLRIYGNTVEMNTKELCCVEHNTPADKMENQKW